MSRGKSFEPIRRELHQQLRTEKGWNHLRDSVEGISRVLTAIAETTDDNWVHRVRDAEGHPLLEEKEKKRFTEVFRPYVPAIRQYLNPGQRGGQEPSSPASAPASTAPNAAPASAPNASAAPNAAPASTAAPASLTAADATAATTTGVDMDGIFTGMVKKSQEWDKYAQSISSEYGLLKWEREYDQTDDFHAIPGFIRTLIGSLGQGGMAVKEVLDKIKVPFRLIVFLVYLALDVSRLSASAMGDSSRQRVLSILLAILELFRGDWKKAILTFMGLYGTTPLLVGQVLKVFLYLFERLSPTIQERMVYGAWDTSKSLLLGILLSLFQLTAPLSVRKPFMEMLEKLAKGKEAIDQSLVEAGLEPRPDHFAPTWEDINRLQAVNDDPVFICSCEYEEVLKNIGDSALMKFILQLLRLPINQDMREKYTCVGKTPCQPYRALLIQEQTPSSAPASSAPASSAPASSASPPVSSAPEMASSAPLSPEMPAAPALPVAPAVPELPAAPALPVAPAVPTLPTSAPLSPELPAAPALPASTSLSPAVSRLPASASLSPEMPAAPALPVAPLPASRTPVLPPAPIVTGGGKQFPCFF